MGNETKSRSKLREQSDTFGDRKNGGQTPRDASEGDPLSSSAMVRTGSVL